MSQYQCPKCGGTDVLYDNHKKEWECMNPECRHTWIESIFDV